MQREMGYGTNKFDVDSQEYYKQSDKLFANLRKEQPISKQGTQYGRSVWLVTRYADVDAMLRDSQHFVLDYRMAFDPETLANEPPNMDLMQMVNSHLLTKEGEDHRRLRSLVTKAFTPRRIAEMRPRIQGIADELLDGVRPKGQMDLVDEYAFPLPITVIAELLGIPQEDREKFRQWSDAFVTAPFKNDFDDSFYQGAMGFVMYLGQLFEQRRANPQDDMISALLAAEEEGDRLSTEELFSMVVLLIIAGHETTVTLIGNATVALLTHPEVMEQLKANPSQMPQAVEESLRWNSPVQRSVNRWVAHDVELGGQKMRRGDIAIAILGSANRDEAQFSCPADLDVAREPNPHVAFGKGAHYCLGAPLARLEGEIALNMLLRKLPNLELAVPVEELVFRETPLFHAYQHIPVRWK